MWQDVIKLGMESKLQTKQGLGLDYFAPTYQKMFTLKTKMIHKNQCRSIGIISSSSEQCWNYPM